MVLAGPAGELARDVAGGLAEVGEAARGRVEIVERGEGVDDVAIGERAIGGGSLGEDDIVFQYGDMALDIVGGPRPSRGASVKRGRSPA